MPGPDNWIAVLTRAKAALSRRHRRQEGPAPEPPHLFDDPLEALLVRQGGGAAAFHCPIDRCTHHLGFRLSRAGWHPFVAAIIEYASDPSVTYASSILKRFYDTWQPRNAAEALAGLDAALPHLRRLPPYCFYLTPWTAATSDEIVNTTEHWVAEENVEHGRPELTLAHGIGYFGPVDPRKGELEFRRLVQIHGSIAVRGYDRSQGDVNVRVLKRGSELQFIVDGGGMHRVAAMAAAGHATVPAVFREPFVIREEEAYLWPQVRSGTWTLDEALRYFHHLFDFDSRAWATRHGLADGPSSPASP